MTNADEITCPHPAGGTVSTLCEAFQRTASMRPDAVALRVPGGQIEITWREYAERVRAIATGLSALGVKRGDTVGIMLTNRPEFNLVDTAALHLGATPFSIYNTSTPEQINYLFSNAENAVVITEQQFLQPITNAETGIEHIVTVDGESGSSISLADLESRTSEGFDFEATWRAVGSDDIATLIYTSGTTGPPKGVEIPHSSIVAEVNALIPILEVGPDDSTASYLPSAHIADRVACHYAGIMRGMQITSVADPKAIAGALPDARPTIWFAVPRVWQKIKAGIEAKLAEESSPVKKKLANWAIETGIKAARERLAGRQPAGLLGVQSALADKLVLAKLRDTLGLDRIRWAASGASAIPPEVLEYFHGLGIPVYEVWGMSESTGATTSNAAGATKIGTVGKAVSRAELKLADDGELLVRGPVLMRGYRKQPEKTAETIDSDGWLHTGDIAEIDSEGFVKIIDRKKELIINEAGKNMSPTNIENALKASSSLIGQAVAIGDNRPYVTALIVLDPDAAAARASSLGMSDTSVAAVAKRPEVREEITRAAKEGNERLSRVEQIKRFRLVAAEWEPGGEELTPTLKLKRKPIADKYKAEIEELYADSPGEDVVNLA
ncbi:long-chain fatty acid--CoA ligase [Haloechinothrix sp. YIM 98757]|uniref:Acyl-CoA synthetase n=1 Tax=Haloechinothrix aidingensis TaxID=2752311 RepID=A0A838ADQ4_9PSEU|nr:long-chain fatty acid--CoA ligase [Haloechinothrix aidingensis]